VNCDLAVFADQSASVGPTTQQTNDPSRDLKQIQLHYAGIGTAYGCAGDRLLVQEMPENDRQWGD
jgi:hypothetical protein